MAPTRRGSGDQPAALLLHTAHCHDMENVLPMSVGQVIVQTSTQAERTRRPCPQDPLAPLIASHATPRHPPLLLALLRCCHACRCCAAGRLGASVQRALDVLWPADAAGDAVPEGVEVDRRAVHSLLRRQGARTGREQVGCLVGAHTEAHSRSVRVRHHVGRASKSTVLAACQWGCARVAGHHGPELQMASRAPRHCRSSWPPPGTRGRASQASGSRRAWDWPTRPRRRWRK